MIMFSEDNIIRETDADVYDTVDEAIATNVGVINPYALAEVIKGEKINWDVEADPAALLESILQMPYDQLFDPIHGSPLYMELAYEPGAEHLTRQEGDLTIEATMGQLEVQAENGHTNAGVRVQVATKVAVEAVVQADNRWIDIGEFFKGGTELFDPVQGAVGDCYLIAALSAVAWSRPYSIEHRTRPVDQKEGFTNMVEFLWGGKSHRIEVTEKLLMRGATSIPKYARSSDAGEIWPGVYEKAYAKWKTNHTGDTPNIQKIAGGDPVRACSELTGLKRYYYSTSLSADDIWAKVFFNSMLKSVFNPMVAWTWPSSSSAPNGVNYNNANLVANHAYSIHGWDQINGKKYIILRNPWGQKEATVGITSGYWVTYDYAYKTGRGFWRKVSLPTNDGLFAIEATVFKKYFRGLGLVK